jgi:hypothetical protein
MSTLYTKKTMGIPLSILGDVLIIIGMWALMGHYPKIENIPTALYLHLQRLHPMWSFLLPLGIICALLGRGLTITYAHNKLRTFAVQLFSLGRLPLFEGIACLIAFILIYNQLSPTESFGMLLWASFTIIFGSLLLWISWTIANKK